jgi:hypothetical protein
LLTLWKELLKKYDAHLMPIIKKAPKKEPFHCTDMNGFNLSSDQDYPEITPRLKIEKILINISICYKLQNGFDSHALPPLYCPFYDPGSP